MKNMTLDAIAKACDGKLVWNGDKERTNSICATCVVIDSRKMEKNGVFIATKGERVDGHDFIGRVFDGDALGVVCEKEPENASGPYILVEDSFAALSKIAAYYRKQIDAKVIGITGSVGKTSTKEFVACVLSSEYPTWKTQGNYNNEIGMPLTILQTTEEHKMLVLEMGINHFGEMDRMSAIAKPDVMVITNIGQCHLEFLVDRDGVYKAKTECFEHLADNAVVVVNGDDDKLCRITSVKNATVTKFGMNSGNDCYADNVINHGLFGNEAILHSKKSGESYKVNIPLPGKHMILNALTAMAVGEALNVSKEGIIDGIQKVQATSGRSNIIKGSRYTVIDDCYNANPVSMKTALDLLATADTRKVAILGDMFELGEDEVSMHAEVGEYAAYKTDVIICVGKLSHAMYEAAKNRVSESYYFEDMQKALEELDNILQKADSVLVKASHGMHFDAIVDTIIK